MWQSSVWNGQTATVRNSVVVRIVFLIIEQRESEA
jgi:predicted small integral membrane protein